MFVGLFAQLSHCGQDIASCLFEKLDFCSAYNETVRDDSFSPHKFWFYRRFLNLHLDAFSYLYTQESSPTRDLLVARSTEEEACTNNKVLTHMIGNLANSVSEELLANKLKFNDVDLFSQIDTFRIKKGQFALEDILSCIESNNTEITSAFFEAIDSGRLPLKDAKQYLLKVANKDSRAYKLLGDIEFYSMENRPVNEKSGSDNKNNTADSTDEDEEHNEHSMAVDRAMEYYWAGSELKSPECFIGLGKVMETYYDDSDSAKEFYEKALAIRSINEGLYLLGRLEKNEKKIQQAAFKGYIPAMTHYFKGHIDNGDTSSATVRSVLSILKFHPHIMDVNTQAKQAYKNGEYAKAFLLALYMSEFNLENAALNVVYIYQKHGKNLKMLDSAYEELREKLVGAQAVFNNIPYSFSDFCYFDAVQTLSKTKSAYNKELGLCHLNGVGTKKSSTLALGCFSCAPTNDVESAYHLAMMYERGDGTSKNIKHSQALVDNAYFQRFPLVYWYLKLHFIAKTFGIDAIRGYLIKIGVGILTICFLKMGNMIYTRR